jgi:KDO2-lipid IV(A) lauroyltransferase
MRVEGLEHYREAKQSGRGVILASAHIGNWELSALISVLAGETCHVFALPLLDPQLDAIVNARRTVLGNQVLKDVRGVFRVLTEGGLIALLADGKPVLGPGVPLKFLGQSITVSTAVVRLAGQTGASILPMFALWSDVEHRWVVTIHPLLTLTGDADHDTRQLHARMEAVIRKHPGQYFWILPL